MQVNDLRQQDPAGHGLGWSIPGHLTPETNGSALSVASRRRLTDTRHLEGSDLLTSGLTPHQNERQMSVASVISASRYRP